MNSVHRKEKLYFTILLLVLFDCAFGFSLDNDQEFQFSGGFFLAEGDASTGTAQAEVAYGYYLTPKWQTGARFLFSYALNDPAEDVWTGSTTGFLNYYWRGDQADQKLQPFVGAFLGLGYTDVDVNGAAGPIIGSKYFVTDEIALMIQYRYEFYFDSLDAGAETEDFDEGNHVLTLGIGYHW